MRKALTKFFNPQTLLANLESYITHTYIYYSYLYIDKNNDLIQEFNFAHPRTINEVNKIQNILWFSSVETGISKCAKAGEILEHISEKNV